MTEDIDGRRISVCRPVPRVSGSLPSYSPTNRSKYQAQVTNEETGKKTKSHLQRSFCKICGSSLWVWSPKWPELIHPFASIIDSSLPIPPERTHLMTSSKTEWAVLRADPQDQVFEQYPKESIAEWHKRLGLEN